MKITDERFIELENKVNFLAKIVDDSLTCIGDNFKRIIDLTEANKEINNSLKTIIKTLGGKR